MGNVDACMHACVYDELTCYLCFVCSRYLVLLDNTGTSFCMFNPVDRDIDGQRIIDVHVSTPDPYKAAATEWLDLLAASGCACISAALLGGGWCLACCTECAHAAR